MLGRLAVDFVGVLQGAGDGLHVLLDALGPGLDVADLLEAAAEAVHQGQPLLRLSGEFGGVGVQFFGLGVQSLLVEVGLGHAHIQVVDEGVAQLIGGLTRLPTTAFLDLAADVGALLVFLHQVGEHLDYIGILMNHTGND